MQLYNTLTRELEEFTPINPPHVGIYCCGPTVYDFTHIGHLRKYIGDDILVRILKANDFEVKHVMNITDVGHLTSDGDEGIDKLEKGAEKHGKTPLEVAQFFEEDFWDSLKKVNVEKPDVAPRATEHIEDQIALIEILIEKGFTYQTSQAIYFDVSKYPDYAKLAGQDLDDKETGAREGVVVDKEKKNPQDFALWFFATKRFENHSLRWDSPWGVGFPGWHIECSAMSMKYLGLHFDIHTGGIDHIPVHHANEIAQSESATGEKFVNYWVHYGFLRVNETKMSKSLENTYRIHDLIQKGFTPLAFRYLTLQTHYRSEMNFTWQALEAASIALKKMYEIASKLPEPEGAADKYEMDFLHAVNQDMNMPKALSIVWEMLRSNVGDAQKAAALHRIDEILGLKIFENAKIMTQVPGHILNMLDERQSLRNDGKFLLADQMRHKIEKMGYEVLDQKKGKPKVLKKI